METLFVVAPTGCWSCVGHVFSNFVLYALHGSGSVLLRKRAGWVALMWCGYPCSVSLQHEAVSQSAVCDCEMSWSYSFLERRGPSSIKVSKGAKIRN